MKWLKEYEKKNVKLRDEEMKEIVERHHKETMEVVKQLLLQKRTD
jgi:hypothetical protein